MRPETPWYQRRMALPPYVLGLLLIVAGGLAIATILAVAMSLNALETTAILLIALAVCAIAIGLVYVLAVVAMRWVRRNAVERVVMAHLVNILRQRLPLSRAAAVAGESEPGLAGSCLRNMALYLSAGATLTQAVRAGWPGCPSMVLSLLMVGEKTGQVTLAAEQAAEYLSRQAQRRERIDVPVTPYALAVMTATFVLTAGIMVMIIPKFKEIFRDYDTQLPELTIAYINLSESLLFILLPLLALLAAVVGIMLYAWLRPRRLPEPRLAEAAMDHLRWYLPGYGRVEWARGMAVGIGAMRMGLRAGLDLSAAARLAAETDINVCLRDRFEQFAQQTAGGADPGKAAAASGLGSVAGVALATGRRSGDMNLALQYASDYYAALFSRTWLILRRMAWPVTTVLLGVMVGFVVLAMFLPLIALINSASGGV